MTITTTTETTTTLRVTIDDAAYSTNRLMPPSEYQDSYTRVLPDRRAEVLYLIDFCAPAGYGEQLRRGKDLHTCTYDQAAVFTICDGADTEAIERYLNDPDSELYDLAQENCVAFISEYRHSGTRYSIANNAETFTESLAPPIAREWDTRHHAGIAVIPDYILPEHRAEALRTLCAEATDEANGQIYLTVHVAIDTDGAIEPLGNDCVVVYDYNAKETLRKMWGN